MEDIKKIMHYTCCDTFHPMNWCHMCNPQVKIYQGNFWGGEELKNEPHLHIKIIHPDVSTLVLPALEFKENYKEFYDEEDINKLKFEPMWLSDVEYEQLQEFES